MTQAPAPSRRFSVHPRHLETRSARIVSETSFEAAAVAYAEDLHGAPDDGEEISLIVRDLETGHEHCFTVDLGSGETSACG